MVLTRVSLIIGLLTCLPLLAGCAGKRGPEQKDLPPLTDQAWVLTGGTFTDAKAPLSEERAITLHIAGDVASGSTGCNRYNSPCTIEGNAITLGPMSLTKRACPDFMPTEQAFIAALSAAAFYTVDAATLTITTADDHTLVFRRESDGEH